MPERALLIVVLAAGKGTRMKSAVPKVLHPIGAKSLLGHVLKAAAGAGAASIAVVVGPDMDQVATEARAEAPGVQVFVQAQQLGTGNAVLAARPVLENHNGDVIVLFGDTPLIRAETIAAARDRLDRGADTVVVGFEPASPFGYGRILQGSDGEVLAIREEKDATPAEQTVGFCNSGIMGFRGERLLEILGRIGNGNAKGEYYLTDAIEIARGLGLSAKAVKASADEVLGINDRAQLAAAEALFQTRMRAKAMENGASLVAPETVYFSHDTVLGEDVRVEPFVVFGPGVTVADRVIIQSFSHLTGTDRKLKTGTRIGEGAEIGPFSRLRPGADIGRDAHIGNFVEVKNVKVEDGAKANHLSYLGDGRVGKGANIGAGTIFCNYDGFNKHFTDVGASAFIGSNSSLVAPVKIGDGAFIGSGSVITRDVAPDALALERSQQDERPQWAAKFRQLMARRKAAKAG